MQNGRINHIWELLKTIPDPEIPVISIVELGVVRDVCFNDNLYTIKVTPTYSGCPAVKRFSDDIEICLRENGFPNSEIKLVYAPAWTTEWMSKKTKQKLKKYGIAPPSKVVNCPQCGSKNTNLVSEFGSTACKAFYTCSDCLEPFEALKCI